jgi:hypothetical protein
MTRNEKLDALLNGLANLYIREKGGQKMPRERTIAFLNRAQDLHMESWEMDSLEEQLVHDGHAQQSGTKLRMTENGRKFLAEKHGYVYQAQEALVQEQIKKEPLHAARRDQWKVWLMLAAVLISIAALIPQESWLQGLDWLKSVWPTDSGIGQ